MIKIFSKDEYAERYHSPNSRKGVHYADSDMSPWHWNSLDMTFFVIEESKKIVAVLKTEKSPYDKDTWWISYISVREDRQGKGFSRELINAVMRWAHENGYSIQHSSMSDKGKERLPQSWQRAQKEFPSVILKEKVLNLVNNDPRKEKFKHAVWDMVQSSYQKIGGMKGSGFTSPNEMKKIPLWKLIFAKGEMVAVVLYKDDGAGRKGVAYGSDGSEEGKRAVLSATGEDLDRSFVEMSDPLLSSMVKKYGEMRLRQRVIGLPDVEKTLNKSVTKSTNEKYLKKYPLLAGFFYDRIVNGEMMTKIMLGRKGLEIR